ncbi:glycosyltransferase family 4 protein [Flagellimonas allohymeniacidonis]|uniref:Glycosyltransferase family 1 protein n=1 Tax=Flagellimonas allohymeniacidonis TaxID=2517819 RepID=A0A4Q8QJC2_9FLAO|nr:glycosyltransferase family 4 protein [Allomuricauda hymeniacidonis]TAI48569.1 glycosyltransferase family 1 protein [Allomuricauda hymeniacidonis]
MARKIMLVCSYDASLIGFRGDFIKELVANDFEVLALAPSMSEKVASKIRAMGASPLSYHLQRTGLNPIKDIKSIFQLRRIIKQHKVDIVFPYTLKPVLYSSFAAKMTKARVVSLITGLGFTFSATSKKARFLQNIAEVLYKLSIRSNKAVIFQNKDDLALFQKLKILSKKQKTSIVNGSGVNLERYPFRQKKIDSEKIIFLFVARLIREKGIHLYIEAAKQLKPRFPLAEFHIIGAPDKSPSAIKLEDLTQFHESEIVVYHGRSNVVPEFLERSDVFVLPTYYREGVPRSILEALSVGLPVITTDTPGCRETVVNRENGFLIAPQSLDSLIEAMQFLLENTAEINKMGKASNELAKKKFDVQLINADLIKVIESSLE